MFLGSDQSDIFEALSTYHISISLVVVLSLEVGRLETKYSFKLSGDKKGSKSVYLPEKLLISGSCHRLFSLDQPKSINSKKPNRWKAPVNASELGEFPEDLEGRCHRTCQPETQRKILDLLAFFGLVTEEFQVFGRPIAKMNCVGFLFKTA